MKGRITGILLVVAVGVVAGFVGHKMATSKLQAVVDAEQNKARIQREYLERVAWIRSNPDDKAYRDEVGTFMRWYFKEVNQHMNQYGGNKNFDSYLQELEKRAERLTDAQMKERKQVYEYVKDVFEQFRAGSYSPLYTATDDGMRLDILSADVKMVDGQPKIHLPVVLWGAQREEREDQNRMKRVVTSANFDSMWRLFDAKGKLYAEMPVTGGPDGPTGGRIEHPERIIPEFPPQILLGHYNFDLLPAEVARVEVEFNVTSRSSSGGEARGNYTWKLDVPSEWKLKDGEAWKGAQEDVRPMEDIDPAAAARSR